MKLPRLHAPLLMVLAAAAAVASPASSAQVQGMGSGVAAALTWHDGLPAPLPSTFALSTRLRWGAWDWSAGTAIISPASDTVAISPVWRFGLMRSGLLLADADRRDALTFSISGQASHRSLVPWTAWGLADSSLVTLGAGLPASTLRSGLRPTLLGQFEVSANYSLLDRSSNRVSLHMSHQSGTMGRLGEPPFRAFGVGVSALRWF